MQKKEVKDYKIKDFENTILTEGILLRKQETYRTHQIEIKDLEKEIDRLEKRVKYYMTIKLTENKLNEGNERALQNTQEHLEELKEKLDTKQKEMRSIELFLQNCSEISKTMPTPKVKNEEKKLSYLENKYRNELEKFDKLAYNTKKKIINLIDTYETEFEKLFLRNIAKYREMHIPDILLKDRNGFDLAGNPYKGRKENVLRILNDFPNILKYKDLLTTKTMYSDTNKNSNTIENKKVELIHMPLTKIPTSIIVAKEEIKEKNINTSANIEMVQIPFPKSTAIIDIKDGINNLTINSLTIKEKMKAQVDEIQTYDIKDFTTSTKLPSNRFKTKKEDVKLFYENYLDNEKKVLELKKKNKLTLTEKKVLETAQKDLEILPKFIDEIYKLYKEHRTQKKENIEIKNEIKEIVSENKEFIQEKRELMQKLNDLQNQRHKMLLDKIEGKEINDLFLELLNEKIENLEKELNFVKDIVQQDKEIQQKNKEIQQENKEIQQENKEIQQENVVKKEEGIFNKIKKIFS